MIKILVVEDEANIRSFVVALLESADYQAIFKAAQVSEEFVLEHFAEHITERRRCFFDENAQKVLCRKERVLGQSHGI